MYDDIIENIAYSLALEGMDGVMLRMIFQFCSANASSFFALLGILIGAKFLKDSFK